MTAELALNTAAAAEPGEQESHDSLLGAVKSMPSLPHCSVFFLSFFDARTRSVHNDLCMKQSAFSDVTLGRMFAISGEMHTEDFV
jgi:hypothetical protein